MKKKTFEEMKAHAIVLREEQQKQIKGGTDTPINHRQVIKYGDFTTP
ncbi:MAG: hypothetical protein H6560_05405 [Lewinellaceae bacterium]|nr:hypothetical protein [Lewinellaceae bacterium]